jgi:pimeloyl-ACP methyl ester carboxylesterase
MAGRHQRREGALKAAVEVLGAPVSLRRADGERPALLFLHGAGGNELSLARLFDRLPGRARLAPSYPGRCGSAGAPLESVCALADWAAALLEASGEPSAIVIGHSLGGGVALELALRHPTKVSGLVLLSTGARLRVSPSILSMMREATLKGDAVHTSSFAYRRDTDSELVAEATRDTKHTPPPAAACDWAAADGFDRLNDLGAITARALVIAGAEDELTPPKYARYLATRLPRAELLVLERAGHMLPIERSDEVGRAIASFLDRVAG